MNIQRIWTTNYDFLLEDAYSKHEMLRVIRKDNDLQQTSISNVTQIIKMHGSADELSEVILTREDYDNYFDSHCFIADCFQASVTQNSILFIGYSYSDPDIRAIMVKMKKIHDWTHNHYLITRKPKIDDNESQEEFNKRMKLFEAWEKELARIGIHVLAINEHSELKDILQSISLRSRGKTVYVTGSHEPQKAPVYKKAIVKLLAEQNAILINGQSTGIGASFLNAFCCEVVERRMDICKRIMFFINPYSMNNRYSNDMTLIPELKKARRKLFKNVRVMLAYSGGMGTEVEYDLAFENGCIILPIITDKSDFEKEVIKRFFAYVEKCKDIPVGCKQYYEKLQNKDIPTDKDILLAIKEVLN